MLKLIFPEACAPILTCSASADLVVVFVAPSRDLSVELHYFAGDASFATLLE